jgi:hypothetical protein
MQKETVDLASLPNRREPGERFTHVEAHGGRGRDRHKSASLEECPKLSVVTKDVSPSTFCWFSNCGDGPLACKPSNNSPRSPVDEAY